MKLKVKSPWAFFVILRMSAVICKQRPLRGNKIVQYFQNYKCYDVDRHHFRKHSIKFYKVHEKERP